MVNLLSEFGKWLPPAHLRNHRPPCITQWAFGHGLSCGCKSANMQRGKGLRAGSAGQIRAAPQGQATRAAALYPPFLYSLSKSNRTHGQWDGQRVMDLSPSAVRCHRRGLEHKIRYETGWWLGYLTISGLGTLTALGITYVFCNRLYCISSLISSPALLISAGARHFYEQQFPTLIKRYYFIYNPCAAITSAPIATGERLRLQTF